LFDVIGSEIHSALLKSPASPAEIVNAVLARWRRFWGLLPRNLLTETEIAGLFGELWFLHVWLAPAVGLPLAVNSWRGSFGARHDFETRKLCVEVKTTLQRNGRRHRIHGIDQLRPVQETRLTFFSAVVQRHGAANNTLPTLIDLIRTGIAHEPEAANHFDTALARAGYFDALRDVYSEYAFEVGECLLFDVDEEFPKLTPDLLASGTLAPGVSNVEYDIQLDGHRDIAIAVGPEQAAPVLALMLDI
jgi:hypothetical protein